MDFFNKITSFFRRLWDFKAADTSLASQVSLKSIVLNSHFLNRKVQIDLYLPAQKNTVWSLLLLNDGQDGEQLSLLQAHKARQTSDPTLMIAAIDAGNRIDEYGTAGQLADKGMGSKSQAYQNFILKELLIRLHREYPISANPERVGIAGFSLGALSAIDIAWSWPKVFGIVGIFSGSLWWRDRPYDPTQPDANRIIHRRVENGELRKQRIWLMAGTNDETSDRNGNGIIDAINDTLDLKRLLEKKIDHPEESLTYREVEGGEHNPATWGKVMPEFLRWAYG